MLVAVAAEMVAVEPRKEPESVNRCIGRPPAAVDTVRNEIPPHFFLSLSSQAVSLSDLNVSSRDLSTHLAFAAQRLEHSATRREMGNYYPPTASYTYAAVLYQQAKFF